MKQAMVWGIALASLLGVGCEDKPRPEGQVGAPQQPAVPHQLPTGPSSAQGAQQHGGGTGQGSGTGKGQGSGEGQQGPGTAQQGTGVGAQGQQQGTGVQVQAGAQGYDLSVIKTIPDNCQSASAILVTAPKSVGPDYEWTISRQALLANQQFKVVTGDPKAGMDISLAPYEFQGGYALVARCADGATCNQLAAMYKAIVRSGSPQVICGKVAGIGAAPVGTFRWGATPQDNLPGDKDPVGKCARLSACMIATDRGTAGDPFLECQKTPQNFKIECASRYPCADVLACSTGK
jgi:hypothetical protein